MSDRPRIRYGTPNVQLLRSWLSRRPDEDGPFWAVNLMKYRPIADYGEGGSPRISGREADDRYTPREALAGVGAVIAFAADVDRQLAGKPRWDRIGIVRYPSRAAFLAMQQREDFKRQHVHKDAGMEETIVLCCTPEWASSEATPTGTLVMRVSRFAEGAPPRSPEPPPRGAVALFDVEGVIVGDERRWNRVCFDVAQDESALAALGKLASDVDELIAVSLTPIVDSLKETIREASAGGGAAR